MREDPLESRNYPFSWDIGQTLVATVVNQQDCQKPEHTKHRKDGLYAMIFNDCIE